MSYEDDRGSKMGLLGPQNPKNIFSGRSRPNRPDIESRISAELAGNSAGIGRKIYFLDSLGPGDPFCTLKASITQFAASVSLDEVGGNYHIFGRILNFFRFFKENIQIFEIQNLKSFRGA